ncbi:MAG: DoxX family membrane protein [bacterium]|nr:DoxX family membrane protein [bacterium]
MEKMRKAAPVVLRIGMSLVFLWFGWQQLSDTTLWAGIIPPFYTNLIGLSATTFVLINAWFEIIFGGLLLLGIFSRTTALLLALHMLHITFTVGYNGVGVRDFGLAMGTISVFLYGPDTWCLGKFFYKNKYTHDA